MSLKFQRKKPIEVVNRITVNELTGLNFKRRSQLSLKVQGKTATIYKSPHYHEMNITIDHKSIFNLTAKELVNTINAELTNNDYGSW
jgi:hypothetical protein